MEPDVLPVISVGSRGLELRELTAADCAAYYRLIDRNREHVSRYGDYEGERRADRAWVRRHLSKRPTSRGGVTYRRYGIWETDPRRSLVGRIDLNPVDPPRYSIGYWLDEQRCGRGYATAACGALIGAAREELAATDVYAGVTHGNERSAALLRRLGFVAVERFDTYTRFHLRL